MKKKITSRFRLFEKFTIAYISAIVLPIVATTIILSVFFFRAERNRIAELSQKQVETVIAAQTRVMQSVELLAKNIAEQSSIAKFIQCDYNNPDSIGQNLGNELANSSKQELMSLMEKEIVDPLRNELRFNSMGINQITVLTGNKTLDQKKPYVAYDTEIGGYREYENFVNSSDLGIWLVLDKTKISGKADLAGGQKKLYFLQKVNNKGGTPSFVIALELDYNKVLANLYSLKSSGELVLIAMDYRDKTPLPLMLIPDDYKYTYLLSGESGSFIEDSGIYAYQNLKMLNSYVIFKSNQKLSSSSMSLFVYLMFIIVLGVITLIVITYKITKSITFRIRRMLDVMKKTADGDFGARIPEDYYDDELSTIAENYNNLVNRFDETTALLVRSERLQSDARLMALQNQMNPHFIYNTIELFRMQMELAKISDASDAIAAFGNMLRYNMDINDKYATIEDELAHAKNYIKVMNLRYSGVIDFKAELPSEVKEIRVAKFILQPLVENSIKHGLTSPNKPLSIRIYFKINDSDMEIMVMDNGKGMDKATLEELNIRLRYPETEPEFRSSGRGERHIGLENIAKRLSIFYKGNSRISAESTRDEFTKILIVIPFK